MVVGSGSYRYKLRKNWAKVPLWWDLKSCSDVATDSKDRVFVLTRGTHPVIVFDRDGSFLSSWGEGLFSDMPHGLFISPDDHVYITDVLRHVVRILDVEGNLLQTLGRLDRPADTYYGQPFNMPTGVALASNGNLYVSDGYGNKKVHVFDREGERIHVWGAPGTAPGEFAVVHNLAVDSKNRIYVCDRENNRIQIFTHDGCFLDQWTDLRMPGDICIKDDVVYFVEQALEKGVPRVSIFDTEGNILSCWESMTGNSEKILYTPHGIWVDSRGDIYVAEIFHPKFKCIPRVQKFECLK